MSQRAWGSQGVSVAPLRNKEFFEFVDFVFFCGELSQSSWHKKEKIEWKRTTKKQKKTEKDQKKEEETNENTKETKEKTLDEVSLEDTRPVIDHLEKLYLNYQELSKVQGRKTDEAMALHN